MSDRNNKNELELQRQDLEILEAIYERKQTLSEFAIAHAIAYEQAEDMLTDALRRKKTALTYSWAGNNVPDGTHHVLRQGFRKVLRSRSATVQLMAAEMLADFEDLDAWMEID